MAPPLAPRVPTRLVLVLVATAVVLIPFRSIPWLSFGVGSVLVEPLDVALVVLTVSTARRLASGWPGNRASWAVRGASLLLGFLLVSLAMHPSLAGLQTVLRVAGVAALALTLTDVPERWARSVLATLLLGAAAFQALVALGQVLSRAPLGLGVLGEAADPLWRVGREVAPRGTLHHAYPLAEVAVVSVFVVLALVAPRIAPRLGWKTIAWAGLLALAAVPVGITYSRACAIGVAAGLVVAAFAARRSRFGVVLGMLAIAAGGLVPALVWDDGWGVRAGLWRDTLRTRDVDAISNTRVGLAGSAIATIRSRPLVGVGPGGYTPESQPPVGVGDSARGEIVHNLPLYTAATAGIPAGIVVLGLLVGAAVVAARAGPLTLAVYLSYLPFVLLDRFPYDGVQGLTLTGVWFGAVGLLSRLEHEAAPTPA